VSRKLDLLFGLLSSSSVCSVHSMTRQAFSVVVVKSQVGLVVVADAPASWASIQISAAILVVEGALASVQGGEVVAVINGRNRVTDQVVASMGESSSHVTVLRLSSGWVRREVMVVVVARGRERWPQPR
jgi:hypothetical protein